ncbi:MAG: type II secretion system F family protein [Candidatus Eremiobacteraeota bacterium]|nr:type II secretion system F family protein [Candidatus Eremiobacteraeota bacterium]MCW5869667.1 type II secretion system F family protein [Candidatus Eremiobacteraeota bacterium]
MSQPQPREILNALRQLAILVRLGYPLAEGLRQMAPDASPWLARLGEDMERGDSLEQAMGRQPRLFSPYFRTLIEAAADHPQPDKVLEDLSHWLERSEQVERKVNTVLTYPAVVLLMLFACLVIGLGLVAPLTFDLMHVQQANAVTPSYLAYLVWLPVLPLLAMLLSLVLGQPARPLLWLFPEIRNLNNLASQAVWARAFGSLLAAGVPPIEAVEKSLPIVKDARLRGQMAEAAAQARRGTNLETALARCGLEPSLIWCLDGEAVAQRVLDGADAIDREIGLRADLQLRLMAPRALILIGILCGLALVAFWWPFYSATAAIQ